jgi:hypothetical protein
MSSGGGHNVTAADRVGLGLAALIYAAGLTAAWLAWPAGPTASPIPAATADGGADTAPSALQPDTGQSVPLARHEISFPLEPSRGIEFKYRLDKGAGMVYEWSATGAVKFEFHGEPDGAPAGFADTYRVGEERSGAGVFMAPSRGIHGWYWENAGQTPVTVTLKSSGFYSAGIEFRSTGLVEHPLEH